jgi:hypothetical protein
MPLLIAGGARGNGLDGGPRIGEENVEVLGFKATLRLPNGTRRP